MRKLVFLAAVMIAAFFASTATAQLAGSAHDFSGWATHAVTGQAEMCIPCHTPHNAQAVNAPLWNHATSAAAYTMYDSNYSSTFDGDGGLGIAAPGPISQVCLSCHDGTVNLDAYGGGAGTLPIGDVSWGFTGNVDLGSVLTNDHPISFSYDTSAGADTGIIAQNGDDTVGVANLPLYNDGAGSTDFLECATCHAVHNDGAGPFYLLRADNLNSALCTTCHAK